jgi:hypothetical protein
MGQALSIGDVRSTSRHNVVRAFVRSDRVTVFARTALHECRRAERVTVLGHADRASREQLAAFVRIDRI